MSVTCPADIKQAAVKGWINWSFLLHSTIELNGTTSGPGLILGGESPSLDAGTFGRPGVASSVLSLLPSEVRRRNSNFGNNDFTHLSLTFSPSHPDQPYNYREK